MRSSTTSSPRPPCSSRTPAPCSSRRPRRRRSGSTSCSARGQRQFARKGFRPVIDGVEFDEVEGANDPSAPFPEVTNLLTVEDDFGGWSELSDKFFDEETGLVTQIIAASGKPSDRPTDRRGRPARCAGRRARPGRADPGRVGLGVAMIWFSLLVLIPLAAVVVTATEGGWTAFWAAVTSEQTAAPSASPSALLLVTVVNVGDGHADRLGPGPGPVRRPAGPRGAHRHPVRPAHDRRRAGPAVALRPDSPFGIDIANTRPGVSWRSCS